MKDALQRLRADELAQRIAGLAINLWYSLPEERRERLLARRRRYLWMTAVILGSLDPRSLILVGVAAYFLQPSPRRASSPVLLLLCAVIVVQWVRDLAAGLGLLDDAADSLTMACSGIGMAMAGLAGAVERHMRGPIGLRPLLPWLRRRLDAAAWGIPPFRILLGYKGRSWVSAPRQVATLVIGPPRSGKTSGVIIPNVLTWDGPVVITSTRRDVLDACQGGRSRRGEVWCFDPVGVVAASTPSTVRRLDWSPLRGSSQFDIALSRSRALLAGSIEGTESRDHWRARGTQLLGALLHAAALAHLPMSTVVEWVQSARLDAARHVLTEANAAHALAVVQGIASTPDRERGSIWSAVAGCLAPFDDSTVLTSADRADACPFDAADFIRQPNALFIVAPGDGSTPLAPLVVGLVEEVRETALCASNRTGTLGLPLLLALDEVATICPLPSLPQIMAEGGGRNMPVLAILQDLSQAAERWSREVADSLMTLAGAKLILPGVGDADLLKRIETLVGNEWVEQVSRSVMSSGWFSGSWSWGTYRTDIERPRVPVASIRRLPAGRALALVGSHPAVIVTVTNALRHVAI
ncbi:MAG TPA: type IV secretory system conjugative DNA transfer family protein [Candidatus Angelobacter sp.]|jgi:type IV secretion system protein VirD4|nr:type IV secretory system conjugative DNA transfer family protein [Candidatus Angelobacter sp.]